MAANFQRPKNSDAKQRKVADEYVRLCGYKPGNNQWSDQNGLTLDEIAKQLETSKTNLKRALRIERNLTDSMKELLDTGGVFLDISLKIKKFQIWQIKREVLINGLCIVQTY